jgi:hypothetical protein
MATSDINTPPGNKPVKSTVSQPVNQQVAKASAGATPTKVAARVSQAPSPANLEPAPLPAGAEPEVFGEEPQFHHAAGFWNLPWVQNVLPLATSLALHIGIILVGILFFYTVVIEKADLNKDQTIIPETKSVDKNAMPGGIEHPGPLADPTRDAAQDKNKDTDNSGFNVEATNKISSSEGGSTSNEEASAFEGVQSATGKGHSGAGGSGDAFGSGTGGGSAPFGVPGGGGGLLPKNKFFGMGGNANKIIYLCDASGSMLSVFGALKQQLKTSINTLSVENGQEFNVIFFSDDNCFPLFKDGMHMATQDNIKLAMDFVDNAVSTGGTQPLPAINFALAEKPELLYCLTDGFDQISNFDDVTNAFKKGNPDGKIHVKCIFLESDPDPKLEECLKKIATDPKTDFQKIPKSEM